MFYEFFAKITGTVIRYQTVNWNTRQYFEEFLTDSVNIALMPVCVTREDFHHLFPEGCYEQMTADQEFALLGEKTSDYLMIHHDTVMFHGVAVSYRGRGVIFTGPSGVGKSTHYLYWKLLYGDEVQIINGDKPFMAFKENGEIMLYPGPWKGKENFGQNRIARLWRIVYLEQNQEDQIELYKLPDVILPVASQICHSRSSEKLLKKAGEIETKLIRKILIYRLKNRGMKDSARLCQEQLAKEFSDV